MKDLVGKKFWILTVLFEKERKRKYVRQFQCLCECGNECNVNYSNLTQSHIWSCWCLSSRNNIWKISTIHWMKYTRFYWIRWWIKQRCNNPNNPQYKYYWWIWIKCEWNSFEEFYTDTYENYLDHIKEFWEKNTTIDRYPNQSWNYCKYNCRRATWHEQNINKKWIIEYNWISLKQYCEKNWYKYPTIMSRIRRWIDIETALSKIKYLQI